MELFAKIVNRWNLLTIFAKSSILDIYLGFDYASALLLTLLRSQYLCSVRGWNSQLCPWNFSKILWSVIFSERYPQCAGRKLNVYKTFKRSTGRFLNVLCTINSCPVSGGTGFRDNSAITYLHENYWLDIKWNSLNFWWEWSLNHLPVQVFSPLHDL